MNDKTRFWIIATVIGMVILSVLAITVLLLSRGEVMRSLPSLAAALTLLAIAAVFLAKAYKDVKSGMPIEDERSTLNKMKAGYYTYLLTIYLLLGLAFYSDLPEASWMAPRHVAYIGIAVGAALFMGLWGWLNWKGK